MSSETNNVAPAKAVGLPIGVKEEELDFSLSLAVKDAEDVDQFTGLPPPAAEIRADTDGNLHWVGVYNYDYAPAVHGPMPVPVWASNMIPTPTPTPNPMNFVPINPNPSPSSIVTGLQDNNGGSGMEITKKEAPPLLPVLHSTAGSSSAGGGGGISDYLRSLTPAFIRARNTSSKSGNGSPSDVAVVEHTRAQDSHGERLKSSTEDRGGAEILMPLVSTQGRDGSLVRGVLYKYNVSEISIICCCHGLSFSPADFVAHAGGLPSCHPLRQIKVLLI